MLIVFGILSIVDGGITHSGYSIPHWTMPWYGWVLILLTTLIFALLESRYQQDKKRAKNNWIEAHHLQYGNYPILPKGVARHVNNYIENTPVSQDIELVPISLQQWKQTPAQHQRMYRELADWLHKYADDYIPKEPNIVIHKTGIGPTRTTYKQR